MSANPKRWVPEVIEGGASALPRENLVGSFHKTKPSERAKAIHALAEDRALGRNRLQHFHDGIEEVHAIKRVTQGLVDLAKAQGAQMGAIQWADPDRDPMAVLLRASDLASILAPYFEQPQAYQEVALAFAVAPFRQRLTHADQWAEAALAANYRFPDDPIADIYALQLIARSCMIERYWVGNDAVRVTEWVEPELDPMGALEQAAGVLALMSRKEGLSGIASDLGDAS